MEARGGEFSGFRSPARAASGHKLAKFILTFRSSKYKAIFVERRFDGRVFLGFRYYLEFALFFGTKSLIQDLDKFGLRVWAGLLLPENLEFLKCIQRNCRLELGV